jgi:adenylyltransferase/sulfurtransferase
VDVREENERAINAIPGSAYLPLGRILADPQAARAELGGGPLYLYCLGGARSQKAVDALKAAGADAINVEGGIRAWWTRIDPDMPQY